MFGRPLTRPALVVVTRVVQNCANRNANSTLCRDAVLEMGAGSLLQRYVVRNSRFCTLFAAWQPGLPLGGFGTQFSLLCYGQPRWSAGAVRARFNNAMSERPRTVVVTRVFRAGTQPPDDDWKDSTPAERLAAVWEITRQCLQWNRTGTDEPRLQRSVSRVQRARG
jgi:hypothetical protein